MTILNLDSLRGIEVPAVDSEIQLSHLGGQDQLVIVHRRRAGTGVPLALDRGVQTLGHGNQRHISRIAAISLGHIGRDRLTVHRQSGVHLFHLGQHTLPGHSGCRLCLFLRLHLGGCCLYGLGTALIYQSSGVLLHAGSHEKKHGKGADQQRTQLSCHCLHSYGYKIMSTKVTAKATVCYFCYHIVTNSPEQYKGNFHYTFCEFLVYFF